MTEELIFIAESSADLVIVFVENILRVVVVMIVELVVMILLVLLLARLPDKIID